MPRWSSSAQQSSRQPATAPAGGAATRVAWRAIRRQGAVAVAVTAMAGLVGIAGAGSAAAHDELVSTDPAGGATVVSAPDQVTLTFTDKATALGTQVQVTAPDGSVVSTGAAQLGATTVVQPLAAVRPAGTYTVDWRVTSADGHPVSGTFTFVASTAVGTPTTTEAAVPTPTPTATPTATPAPTDSAGPVPTAQGAASTPASSPGSTSRPAASGSSLSLGAKVGLVVVLAAAALTAALARRRTRGAGTDESRGEPRS